MPQLGRSFTMWAQRLGKAAIDLVFPPDPAVCVACTRKGAYLCDHCAQAVEAPPRAICNRCGQPQTRAVALCTFCQQDVDEPLVMTRAAALHTSPLREAIHQLKYRNCPDIAPLLARYLVAVYQKEPWLALYNSIDAVVPVPLHETQLQDRGYNQAELLGRAFCDRVNLPLYPEWIARTRQTEQQARLGRTERQHNVKGAFIASAAVDAHHILLIDDVNTTGSTLRECATAVKSAGAAAVYALTLAMPVPRGLDLSKMNPDKMTR